MNPLIHPENYREVFNELIGKKVAYVRNPGNLGDYLIECATIQLFNYFKINYKSALSSKFELEHDILNWANHIVYGGGGSMGKKYEGIFKLRQSLFKYKKPITILPQTFILEKEEGAFHQVWVREKKSLDFCPNAKLAPDLALSYTNSFFLEESLFEKGIFLRQDSERTSINYAESLGDPYTLCRSLEEMFLLASQYRAIYTNRLHFAITSLLIGRETYLMPNSYFKNQAVYETWLKDLGCEWTEDKEF